MLAEWLLPQPSCLLHAVQVSAMLAQWPVRCRSAGVLSGFSSWVVLYLRNRVHH
jgi:hypothetical protein